MHVRHATNWCPGKVHGHRYSIFLGQVADLVRFQDAARCRKIRVNLADGMPFAQHAKRLFQVNILAGENRRGTLVGNLFEQIGIGPGDYVLHPGQVVFFISLP